MVVLRQSQNKQTEQVMSDTGIIYEKKKEKDRGVCVWAGTCDLKRDV